MYTEVFLIIEGAKRMQHFFSVGDIFLKSVVLFLLLSNNYNE